MKKILLAVFLFVFMPPVFSAETNTPTNFRIGEYVKLDSSGETQGFLKYTGQHNGTTVCALSYNIGSGRPQEDLRLYAKFEDHYRLMLHLPMLKLKGYRCVGEGDILKIYITPSLEGSDRLVEKLDNSKPLMSVDLSQLVMENKEDYKTSPK